MSTRVSQEVSLAHHEHILKVVQIHEEFFHRQLLGVKEEVLAQLLIEGLHVRVHHPQLVILFLSILHKAVQPRSKGPTSRSRPTSPPRVRLKDAGWHAKQYSIQHCSQRQKPEVIAKSMRGEW